MEANSRNPQIADFSGICYLCFKPCNPEKFREHVPPKGCFPKSSENLITVCCCEKCNNSNSKEDEFFRLITSSVPEPTSSSNAVWDKVLRNTVRKGRIKTDIESIVRNIKSISIGGKEYAKFPVKARRVRLQLIRITKGFIRHYYPEIDYRNFEWHVLRIDQFKIKNSVDGVSGILKHHERGGGAHHCLFGIAEDRPSFGIWVHVFHQGHAFSVTHCERTNVRRKNSGVFLTI